MLNAISNTNYVLNFFNLSVSELDELMGEDDSYNCGFDDFMLTRRVGNKQFTVSTVNGKRWYWKVKPFVAWPDNRYYVRGFFRRTRLHLPQALRLLGITLPQLVEELHQYLDLEFPGRPDGWSWIDTSWSHVWPNMELKIHVESEPGLDEPLWRFDLIEDIEGEGPVDMDPYDDDIPF